MLHELLKVLGQPPVWLAWTLSTLMGTVVGFFSGLTGQLIVPDIVGRRNTRRALYQDLAQMFFAIDLIMNTEESTIGAGHQDPLLWRQEQFRLFPFLGEEFYSDNPAIYIQLTERFAVKTLYRKLQYVFEQPPTSLPFNARSLPGTFAHYVENDVLKRKYIEKYLGKEKALALLHKVDEWNRQRECDVQCLMEKVNSEKPQQGPAA